MLFGSFSDTTAQEIEQALPEDALGLYAVLAQTLSRQVRQDNLRLRRHQESFFNFGEDPVAQKEKQEEKDARQRHELCQKILSKLHDLGHRSRDRLLLADIEKLDACLVRAGSLHKKIGLLSWIKGGLIFGCGGWGLVFLMFGCVGVMTSLAGTAPNPSAAAVALSFLLFVDLVVAVGLFFYYRATRASLAKQMAEVEKDSEHLAERYYR